MSESVCVAVLMGGESAERNVSLQSGATVVRGLCSRHEVIPVEILADGSWRPGRRLRRGADPESPASWFPAGCEGPLDALVALRAAGVQVIFNALHGPLGEDGTIQGLCRTLKLPLTGPDVIAAAVTMDKRLTKFGLRCEDVETPRSIYLPREQLRKGRLDWAALVAAESPRLPLPWVFKPNRLGSSVGVFFARTEEEAILKGAGIGEGWPTEGDPDDLLIEEVVTGRELTCGVLETDGTARALPPIEIRPRSSAFFDYHAKYTPGASEEVCPAPLTPRETELVTQTALRVHAIFALAPLSRTDLFLTPDGRAVVLEVNTLPGMTATSLIPLSASRAGISLEGLFDSLVAHALTRAEALRKPTCLAEA